AWRRMAIICGSLNLLVFIKISSIIKPEKILLLKPINWRGDYPGAVRPCALTMLIAETTEVINSERISGMTIVL
ncbi:hypothetical protein E0H44_32190, partial [Rhizobium leguminosarum bv. viciae]